MRKFLILLIIPVCCSTIAVSQEKSNDDLPYAEIPAAPDYYTPANVVARMIDGLGFRYHWATEGLRAEDLKYRPTKEARSTDETLDHIYELSMVIVNVVKHVPVDRSKELPTISYEEKRKQTLENLKTASDLLKASDGDLEKFEVLFKKDGEVSESPFWNLINGMLTDAIWHTGQVVSFRRTSGNPIRKGVNYFSGTHGK